MMALSVIALNQIRPPRFRLRKDLGELEELKKSISDLGLLNPIVIRPTEGHYEVVAGHRRYVCCIELGKTELSIEKGEVKIVQLSDKQAFELGLTENIDRKDMDATEEAQAFKAYIMDYGFGSGRDLCEAIHRSETYVSRRLDLLRLPEENLMAMRNRGLSTQHTLELSSLVGTHDNALLSKITDEIADKGLTTLQTRKVVNLVKHDYSVADAIQRTLDFPELGTPNDSDKYDPVEDAREQISLAVGKLLIQIDFSLEHIPDGPEKKDWINKVRFPVHELKSQILQMRRKYKPPEAWN